ncbi:F-box/LRR-repeat/kelch-repeat protein At2g29770 [Capsella rubella]|uniref:F-box/LRR-repeat/kelch-repeat protein At2g29770 n=1 Tax=Capsella rubella TaxID=81985 RepID=UPI000CD59B9F|nr:F-box/LRR-repeat/kelch-repeat protein At2g29770 [Capsella rubella]
MAIISETSDDVSNKKPQEEENLAPVTQHIPEGLAERILLRVKRCHYPKLSLFSGSFRNVVASPILYQSRLQLGISEPVLYASIGSPRNSWYILNRNAPRKISLRLSEVRSLPPMNLGSAVVTIGYEMYVIGGDDGRSRYTSDFFLIDCRFHTCSSLPSMQKRRHRPAAGVFDGKIYVIGGCDGPMSGYNWIEVFDRETQIWSSVPVAGPDPLYTCNFLAYVVIQEKIYIKDPQTYLTYEPRHGLLQDLGIGIHRRWHKECCVVEDMLGKLMVLGPTNVTYGRIDVWCVEISLERRQSSPTRGKTVSMWRVLKSVKSPSIDLCCPVTF